MNWGIYEGEFIMRCLWLGWLLNGNKKVKIWKNIKTSTLYGERPEPEPPMVPGRLRRIRLLLTPLNPQSLRSINHQPHRLRHHQNPPTAKPLRPVARHLTVLPLKHMPHLRAIRALLLGPPRPHLTARARLQPARNRQALQPAQDPVL
jgi:hypothetical protein